MKEQIDIPTQTNSGVSELEQIYEMALDLCISRGVAYVDDCRKCRVHEDCLYQSMARGLYNAGYRKQSEPISCGHEKGGEWKWISDDDVICSACGKVFYTADNADAGLSIWSFCPNCGAHMKGATDERAD